MNFESWVNFKSCDVVCHCATVIVENRHIFVSLFFGGGDKKKQLKISPSPMKTRHKFLFSKSGKIFPQQKFLLAESGKILTTGSCWRNMDFYRE